MNIHRHSPLRMSYLMTDRSGNVLWGTKPCVRLEPDAGDTLHQVSAGDRIDRISYRYYRTVRLWWALAEFNNISKPWDLEPGTWMRVPSLERVERAMKEAVSLYV